MTADASPPPAARRAAVDPAPQLYRDVLESMDGGVMTVAPDGRIGIFNTAASRLLGVDADAIRDRTFGEVFMNLQGLEAFSDTVLAAVYEEPQSRRTTVSVRRGDDTERALAVTTVYLVEHAGGGGGEARRAGIVAVFDDVTEVETLRRAEKRLAEATDRQNAELREAYRKIDDNNRALESALGRVQAIRLVAILLVAVLFVGAAWFVWDQTGSALLAGLSQTARGAADAGEGAITVTVSPRPLVQTLSFVGRLAPRREVRVTSPTAGKVARLHFEYGGAVASGQPLVELETAETERRYRGARAEYLKARDRLRELEDWTNSAEITRLRRAVTRAQMDLEARRGKVDETALLLRQGIIPELEHRSAERQYDAQQLRYDAAVQDLELARAKVDADALQIARLSLENAEAAVRELETVMRSAVIVAPVSGIVLQPASRQEREQEAEAVSTGRTVSEGGYLLTIGDIGGLSVDRRGRRGGRRARAAGPAGQDQRRRLSRPAAPGADRPGVRTGDRRRPRARLPGQHGDRRGRRRASRTPAAGHVGRRRGGGPRRARRPARPACRRTGRKRGVLGAGAQQGRRRAAARAGRGRRDDPERGGDRRRHRGRRRRDRFGRLTTSRPRNVEPRARTAGNAGGERRSLERR